MTRAPTTKTATKAKRSKTALAAKPKQTAALTPAAGIDRFSGDPAFMSSLARGLVVVGAFTEQRRKLTIAQISHRTAIPRAAVRRCLYTLEQLGYVHADGHAFSLRPKMLSLGYAYLSSTPLAVSAQTFLDRVSDNLHESSSIAILDGDEMLYLARSATSRIMSVALNVGSRLPAYCTSLGRVLLAYRPPQEIDAYLARVELRALTAHTITSPKKLRDILETVRDNGYALVDQELEIGLRSIAVPVRDTTGAVVAAMNVGAQVGRIGNRDMKTQFLPVLQSAARELGMLLVP